MKKTLLGLSAAALLLSFASCKKDYTCTCKYNLNNKDTVYAFGIADSKRQDAHDACDARETEEKKKVSTAECEIGD